MSSRRTQPCSPVHHSSNPTLSASHRENLADEDEWDDWEDDEVVTPIDPGEQVLIENTTTQRSPKRATPLSRRISKASHKSITSIRRLRSRRKQKAQNAKAGIRLITDMTLFKDSTKHSWIPYDACNNRQGRFVDAAALKALEGDSLPRSKNKVKCLKESKGMSERIANAVPWLFKGCQIEQEVSATAPRVKVGFAVQPDEIRDYGGGKQDHPISEGLERDAARAGTTMARAHQRNAGGEHQVHIAPNFPLSVWSPETPETTDSFNFPPHPRKNFSHASQVPHEKIKFQVPQTFGSPAIVGEMTNESRTLSSALAANAWMDNDLQALRDNEAGAPKLEPKRGEEKPTRATTLGWWDVVVTPFQERFAQSKSPGPPLPKGLEARNLKADGRLREPVCQGPPSISSFSTAEPFQPSETPGTKCQVEAHAQNIPTLSSACSQAPLQEIGGVDKDADKPPPYSPPMKANNPRSQWRAPKPPELARNRELHPAYGVIPLEYALRASLPAAASAKSLSARVRGDIRTSTPAWPLPPRPLGTYLPPDHTRAAAGPHNRVERQRRRHEKETAVARRLGGCWRGRCCIPSSGCFGRPGPEGRRRRRLWLFGGSLALICLVLIIALPIALLRRHDEPAVQSIWVNLTDFPPMPTGVLTVVGPENAATRSICTEPSSLWSCSLPKDQHDRAGPYKANQPTVVMLIQWDNSSSLAWQAARDGDEDRARGALYSQDGNASVTALSKLQKRQAQAVFEPSPRPPPVREMRFLGLMTDGILGADKEGEPTPFYISLPKTTNGSSDAVKIFRRGSEAGNQSLPRVLLAPALGEDGTPAPAVLLPNPVQQPVRLFDRGLSTEHYGFYTYFRKSLFVKSVTVPNDTTSRDEIPLDLDGGCRKNEADYLLNWGETRLLVRIWTRRLSLNVSNLLEVDSRHSRDGKTAQLIRPGTMPYPVSVTLDTHGGDPMKKFVWNWAMDKRQKLDLENPQLLANRMDVGGSWINPRDSGDPAMGGFDGGIGGCRCEWVNWTPH